jgi:hypothetical protein
VYSPNHLGDPDSDSKFERLKQLHSFPNDIKTQYNKIIIRRDENDTLPILFVQQAFLAPS